MPRKDRFSAFTPGVNIKKLHFIQRKLRISRGDIQAAWSNFAKKFADSEVLNRIPRDYVSALEKFCAS